MTHILSPFGEYCPTCRCYAKLAVDRGECRCNPPTATDSHGAWFPVVDATVWCWKHITRTE